MTTPELLTFYAAVFVLAAMPVARSVSRAILPPWPLSPRVRRQASGDLWTLLLLTGATVGVLLWMTR